MEDEYTRKEKEVTLKFKKRQKSLMIVHISNGLTICKIIVSGVGQDMIKQTFRYYIDESKSEIVFLEEK